MGAISFGVHFIVRKNKVRNGRGPIYGRIVVNQDRCEFGLKKWIELSEWNGAKGMAKPKNEDLRELNSFLEQVRGKIAGYFQELLLKKQLITPQILKNRFFGIVEAEKTLRSLIEYHNRGLGSPLAKGTLKNYFTTERYLHVFLQQKYKTSDLYLSQLNYQFITEFEMFLRKQKPKKGQKKLENNGTMKHLERLRKLTNLAVKLEWLEKNPFERFKLKFLKRERGFLTREELQTLEDFPIRSKRHFLVRDLFIFSCYTGLAYADTMTLRPAEIEIGIDGGRWIRISRQKTDTLALVPLLDKAQTIVEKYKKDPRAEIRETVFPGISNQKMNDYLKEIGSMCGITKNLTFHLARHTFATTVTLSNGVPIETVSKMLGHTKISTTQIYAKVVERKISEDMKLLKEKLA